MSDKTSAGQWLERLGTELKSRMDQEDLSQGISLGVDDPAARAAEEQVNRLLDHCRELTGMAEKYHESSMELALGLSEAFEVLASVQRGNFTARVSDDMIASKDELISQLGKAINETARQLNDKTAALEDMIHRQEMAIKELSTPILRLWDNVLALPVMGIVDSARTAEIMDRLLKEIVTTQSRCVIIDITGVDVVDTRTADNFVKVIKAAELVGAKSVVTGISPAVAQTLVEMGVEMGSIVTLRNLQDGLRECIRYLESRRAPAQRQNKAIQRPE